MRGQLKGRVGGNYFSWHIDHSKHPVTKVSTVNTDPNNPNTESQVIQRAKLANVSKFVSQFGSRFFRFAFDDQKANESAANAFVRHNFANSLFLPKQYVKSSAFPALGNKWQLTQGTLVYDIPFVVEGGTNQTRVAKLAFDKWGTFHTVESINIILHTKYGVPLDSYVTIVFVATPFTELSESGLDSLSAPLVQIFSWNVNASGAHFFSQIPRRGSAIVSTPADEGQLVFNNESNFKSVWAAFIISKQGNRMRTTTSYLVPNGDAAALINSATADNVNNEALASWGAASSAILEGSVADGALDTASELDKDGSTVTSITCSTTNLAVTSDIFLLGDMEKSAYKFIIKGTSLPDSVPVSDNVLRATVSDYLFVDKTEIQFIVNRGTYAGDVNISYAGLAIIKAYTPGGVSSDQVL